MVEEGDSAAKKCPMRRFAWWGKGGAEGEQQKQQCPVSGKTVIAQQQEGGACPMHKKEVPEGGEAGKCPVRGGERGSSAKYMNPKQFDVYSRPINPDNNMPSQAAQEPAPNQKGDLSKQRVASSIPKGGSEGTWLYPSPQMFWNAMQRKGKAEDTEEKDMDVVVAIHNNMNEKTWRQIAAWEKVESPTRVEGDTAGSEPRLLRFEGRPHDLSPLARVRALMGYPLPFDRHDWYVDKGGKIRRYVIDYYHDEKRAREDAIPSLLDDSAVKSIIVDARPAVDDLDSFVLRYVKMPAFVQFNMTDYRPLGLMLEKSLRTQSPLAGLKGAMGSMNSKEQTDTPAASAAVLELEHAKEKCSVARQALSDCKGDEQCAKASMGLTFCMSSIVCPKDAELFMQSIKSGDSADAALQKMEECLRNAA